MRWLITGLKLYCKAHDAHSIPRVKTMNIQAYYHLFNVYLKYQVTPGLLSHHRKICQIKAKIYTLILSSINTRSNR